MASSSSKSVQHLLEEGERIIFEAKQKKNAMRNGMGSDSLATATTT